MFSCLISLVILVAVLKLLSREQEEIADQDLEKLHQAAIQGKFRERKRNHGVGMDDSDEDSDEDERNARIRRGMHKKQKIERANIKELGEFDSISNVR